MAAENWASFAGDDEFSNNLVHDFSEVDSALLMSILDDTPQGVVGEDYDDERLRSVIQSLEAEIHGCTAVDDYDHFFTDTHHQSFDDSDNFKNQHFWESDDLKVMEMEMEMEMEIESSFSIPNNEGVVVNSWFVDYPNDCENRSTIMDGMVEDGDDDGYGYLWQETMPQH